MARILTAGNELGDYLADGLDVWRGAITSTRNQPAPAQSFQRNRGEWSFYLTNDTGLEFDLSDIRPGGVSEFYTRFHIYRSGRTDGNWELLRFTTADGTVLTRFGGQGSGVAQISGGSWVTGFYNNSGGVTPFVTGSNSLRNDQWQTVELHCRFSGSDGLIEAWVNGIKDIEWTGILTGPLAETQMYLYRLNYDQLSGGVASSVYFDDIAVNDTTGTVNTGRVGEGFILPLWPAGPGSSSQLTNTFGTTVDNFKFVNKPLALNPSGFVGTDTANNKDLYEAPALPPEFQGVNSIRLASYGVRNGPAISKAKFIVKPTSQAEVDQPSGVGVGVDLPIGLPQYFTQDFESNPNTSGEPYTKDEIDGMEIGVQFIA